MTTTERHRAADQADARFDLETRHRFDQSSGPDATDFLVIGECQVNRRPQRGGGHFDEGLVVGEIRRDGVVFTYRLYRFFVGR